jgi:hypothetical protein
MRSFASSTNCSNSRSSVYLGERQPYNMYTKLNLLLFASTTYSYSWVPEQPGVDTALFHQLRQYDKRQANCPFNANHEPAAPYNPKFPYTGARNGLPGTGKGGIKVPADGDTAHAFRAPTGNDIRGPCPGMNVAANVRVALIQHSTFPLIEYSITS